MNDNLNPYAALGVPTTATPAEITHAFRAKLRVLHPDTGSAAVGDTQLRHVLAATACCETPTAAPTTTAPPTSLPRRPHRAVRVHRRRRAHHPTPLGQSKSRSHTTASTTKGHPTRDALCGQGRCADNPDLAHRKPRR